MTIINFLVDHFLLEQLLSVPELMFYIFGFCKCNWPVKSLSLYLMAAWINRSKISI